MPDSAGPVGKQARESRSGSGSDAASRSMRLGRAEQETLIGRNARCFSAFFYSVRLRISGEVHQSGQAGRRIGFPFNGTQPTLNG